MYAFNFQCFSLLDDSVGLSNSISLDPGGSGVAEFCLVWDMPTIKYKKDRKIQKRYKQLEINMCTRLLKRLFKKLHEFKTHFNELINNYVRYR